MNMMRFFLQRKRGTVTAIELPTQYSSVVGDVLLLFVDFSSQGS
jgi:hypothetical protein